MAFPDEAMSPQIKYEQEFLEWLRKQAQSGVGHLKKERAFTEIQRCVDMINGDQTTIKSKALSQIYDNRLRKIVLETVSALTDVRPIWNYDTSNEKFKDQAIILNKLARGWWKNNKIDRQLQSILTFACVGGSGYGYLQWNEEKGDFDLIALDPRDVIPIDPVFSDTIQDWTGVIMRRRLPLETLADKYPTKRWQLERSEGDWFGLDSGRAGKMTDYLRTAFDIIRGGSSSRGKQLTGVDVMTVFLKDDSINSGDEPVVMGPEEANWSYTVFPVGSMNPNTGEPVTREEAKLYPRGRMIICTTNTILEDGPNPYWHGMFPIIRFTLDPLPWSLLGGSMVCDLIPLQQALNEAIRGWDDAIAQWVRRGVVGDRQAISRSNLDALDTRRGGLKVYLNSSMGEGFKVLDGPSLPPSYLSYPEFIKREMDENSGVLGLQETAQLRNQIQEENAVEKFKEALSPLLKLRCRSIETSLGELGEMLKMGFFQYYDAPRRMQILGPNGLTLEDFDYDPDTLVPEGEESRDKRAMKHKENFHFSIAPNSFLNVSHMAHKMMIMQLYRANGIDIYSMWDAMDLPDIGEKPAETVPERMEWARQQGLQQGPTRDLVAAQTAAAIAGAQMQQAQAAMAVQQMQMPQQGMVGPVDSSQQGGGGQGVPSSSGSGPQGGRPPSGQAAPQMVMKNDEGGGQRMVISESGR